MLEGASACSSPASSPTARSPSRSPSARSAEGAEVVLTGFGRGMRITERIAKRLPDPPDVLELDVNEPGAHRGRRRRARGALGRARRRPARDRLRARGRARRRASSTRRPSRPSWPSARAPSRLKALARRRCCRCSRRASGGGSIVGLDFDATVAWPVYDWMGVAKAALESVNRYLARDLGPRGVALNLVSAGPLRTIAARRRSPASTMLADAWERRRRWAGTPATRGRSPTRASSCSQASRAAITGEIVHVDGGYHALGAPLAPPAERSAGLRVDRAPPQLREHADRLVDVARRRARPRW